MKIGVITFWQSSDNYGQQLQCWALQQYLQKEGHHVFLIRYDFANRIIGKGIKNKLKRSSAYHFLKNLYVKLKYLLNRQERERGFINFRSENIVMSKDYYGSLENLKNHSPLCDAYIVGSDQVWSQLLSLEENEVFYLNFGERKTKKISYAPSFALKEYPQHLRSKLKEMLRHLDAISVRDDSSVRICESVGVKAPKVVDPTLLLSGIEYDDLLKNTPLCFKKEYAFIYSINIKSPEELHFDDLKNYCDRIGIKCIATASSGYIPAKELLPVDYVYPKVGEWIGLIKNASFVVTPSFHGVVFCLIMHTPFIYIPLKGSFADGNDRVLSLLSDLSLESCVLHDNKSYEEILSQQVNWNDVDDKIEKMKESSINFLKSSLND